MNLVEAVNFVIHSIGRDPEYPKLQALHFARSETANLRAVVATDGHRMAVAAISNTEADDVPPFTVGGFTKKPARFRKSGQVLDLMADMTRRRQDFPDWEAVLPREAVYQARFSRADMLTVLMMLRRELDARDFTERLVYDRLRAQAMADIGAAEMAWVEAREAHGYLGWETSEAARKTVQAREAARKQMADLKGQTPYREDLGVNISIEAGSGVVFGEGGRLTAQFTVDFNDLPNKQFRSGVNFAYLFDAIYAFKDDQLTLMVADQYQPLKIQGSGAFSLIMPIGPVLDLACSLQSNRS